MHSYLWDHVNLSIGVADKFHIKHTHGIESEVSGHSTGSIIYSSGINRISAILGFTTTQSHA